MKIVDRILYRTDGVTQVSVVSPIISGVDSGRLDGDELLSLFNNFFVPSQKNPSVYPFFMIDPSNSPKTHEGSNTDFG